MNKHITGCRGDFGVSRLQAASAGLQGMGQGDTPGALLGTLIAPAVPPPQGLLQSREASEAKLASPMPGAFLRSHFPLKGFSIPLKTAFTGTGCHPKTQTPPLPSNAAESPYPCRG